MTSLVSNPAALAICVIGPGLSWMRRGGLWPSWNAPAKAAGLRAETRPCSSGSFHFDDAGQDAVKAVHKDVMQPAEQR